MMKKRLHTRTVNQPPPQELLPLQLEQLLPQAEQPATTTMMMMNLVTERLSQRRSQLGTAKLRPVALDGACLSFTRWTAQRMATIPTI
jgi:hypothetical protein